LPEKGGVARKTVHLSFAADWSEEVNPLLNFKQFNEQEGLTFSLVDYTKYDPFQNINQISAQKELDKMLDTMVIHGSGLITSNELKAALLTSYEIFYNYNKKKYSLLDEDEQLAIDLRTKKFKEWDEFIKCLKECKAEDFKSLLKDSQELWTVAANLIAVSRSIINMSNEGKSVYDPLYEEFSPWIDILIKLDTHKFIESIDDSISIFEINRLIALQTEKISQPIPKKHSLNDIMRYRKLSAPLRELINTYKELWDDAANIRVDKLQDEIVKISHEIKTISKTVPYSIWVLSLLIGFPSVVNKIGSEHAAYIATGALGCPIIAAIGQSRLLKLAKMIEDLPQIQTVGITTHIDDLQMKFSSNNLHITTERRTNYWTG
jgi:hypothetical protein